VLGGPIRLLRELVPLIGEGGAIVWIASSSVREPIPGLDLSNAFRPGIAALVKVLARELGPRIRVNGIAPGLIDTERIRDLGGARPTTEIPLGRIGEPAELGRVAAFLLSPEASYVTGTMLQVDGGLVTALP
jgi:3-oxoacyl-[acyl-carrier protein] reductase